MWNLKRDIYIFFVDLLGLPLLREHKGKALDGTFLCFSLIKQVTFRQFDC